MKPYLALKKTNKLLIDKISINLRLVQLKPNRGHIIICTFIENVICYSNKKQVIFL